MFYIVENEKNLKRLSELGKYGCFLDVITTNDNFHPKLSDLVAVYVHPLYSEENKLTERGYIIPVSHTEGLGVKKSRIEQLLKKFSKVFVLNKKSVLYQFNHKTMIDIELLYSMTFFKRLSLSSRVSTYNWYYNQYGGEKNLNRIIPLSKIYERCEERYAQVSEYFELEIPSGFQFYNEIATKVYFMVEQEGIRVDVHGFVDRFKPQNIDYSLDGEVVYNQYNLYNVTSRPTNSFNSVNFLAIPKGKEYRQVWKPRNSMFVEMDFDGYHIRLISRLVNYPLNVEDKAHVQVARTYTDSTEDLSTLSGYARAKKSNFQIIYGNPSEECASTEISKKIQNYIVDLWKQFKSEKYIVNPESNKHFTSELKDMTDKKLFNYLVQSLETSRNIKVLYRLLRRLQGFRSKVVLVTYDSFLLDWDETEPEALQIVKEEMEKENGKRRFPVGIRYSKDLDFSGKK